MLHYISGSPAVLANRGWSDKLYLGSREISAQEKAEWGNIFAADNAVSGALMCICLESRKFAKQCPRRPGLWKKTPRGSCLVVLYHIAFSRKTEIILHLISFEKIYLHFCYMYHKKEPNFSYVFTFIIQVSKVKFAARLSGCPQYKIFANLY
jgi:hypothetical protein